jgi:GH25 family lysozyme M1 (1,4-beta-N-acetylmuramidase)
VKIPIRYQNREFVEKCTLVSKYKERVLVDKLSANITAEFLVFTKTSLASAHDLSNFNNKNN